MERFVIAASTLSVPSRIDHLRPVLAFARELAILAGFSPVERRELELALEEIFTHVVVQGFEMTSQENFQIVFELTAKGMNVTFLEKGLPFDLAEIPPYSPMSGEADMRGIGLFLARKAVDKFEFSYMGRSGIKIRLEKYRDRQRQSALTAAISAPKESPMPNRTDINFRIRAFRPSDAMAVARCAYRSFGYSFEPYIYEPAALTGEAGRIAMVAAVEGDEEIIGYSELDLEGTIGEFGAVFVNPQTRGLGLMQKLALALAERCRQLDLLGFYCRSVTTHTLSQKTVAQFGGADCGIFLAMLPQVEFKGMDKQSDQRLNLVLGFVPLKPRDCVSIFPPVRHRGMIEKIYAALKFSCRQGEPVVVPATDAATIFQVEEFAEQDYALIRLSSYGPDAARVVREHTAQLFGHAIKAVYLYLDLQHPSTAGFAAEAESRGFLFAGVLPGGGPDGRDALILQKVNLDTVDWLGSQLASPLAREIFAYIRCDCEQWASGKNVGGDADGGN